MGPISEPAQGGRPIGFMAAWLAHGCADKASHWTPAAFAKSHAQRTAARRVAESAENASDLFEGEMVPLAGEDEPIDLAPYLNKLLN